MIIVHLTLVLKSVWPVSASDFRPDELNALLSLQNRQEATQQLAEESQTTNAAPPAKVSFCPHFCGLASAQNGRGCCVTTDGGMKFWASVKTNRVRCEESPNTSVWCTGGQHPWPGTKGNTLMKIAGWDCKYDEGWHLGGATGVVCDLPTLTAVEHGVTAMTVDDVSTFTDPPFVPTPAPTSAPTSIPTFSILPTPIPTSISPTPIPTSISPTPAPTSSPTSSPTFSPTPAPTFSPTPAPTSAPTYPPAEWDLVWEGSKCTGQKKDQTIEVSQYHCEQLAIQGQHAFYQYHARKGLCVTLETCFNKHLPIVAQGWSVYRENDLWPLKETAQSCSSKRKDNRDASSQMECQQAAEDRVNPNTNLPDPASFYTWNSFAKKCSVSKKCKNKPEKANFATYEMMIAGIDSVE